MRLPRTLLGLLAGAALGPGRRASCRRSPAIRSPTPGCSASTPAPRRPWSPPSPSSGVTAFPATSGSLRRRGRRLGRSCTRSAAGGGATPARLALAGAALNAALYSYVSAVMLLRHRLAGPDAVLDGRLARQRRHATVATVAAVHPGRPAGRRSPLARPLNALALGDDAARALGARPAAIRAAAIVAVTLLCGAATAACGPIAFVGLMVPHMVRSLTGPDLRWLLPYSAVLAPVLLLGADVLGRVLGRPGELQVGIVTAVLGGPFFLVWSRRGEGGATCERAPYAARRACCRARSGAARGLGRRRPALRAARRRRWPWSRIGSGDYPMAPGRRAAHARRRRHPGRRLHRQRAAAAAAGHRRCWSVPRWRWPARSSRRSSATRWAAPTSSASPRVRPPAR